MRHVMSRVVRCSPDIAGISYFTGHLDLPISVGTVGGALSTHPLYTLTHTLLHHPDAPQLASILTCVGLAQNFAAMRALAVEGIQKGHMALHAQNVAVASGIAEERLVDVVCM